MPWIKHKKAILQRDIQFLVNCQQNCKNLERDLTRSRTKMVTAVKLTLKQLKGHLNLNCQIWPSKGQPIKLNLISKPYRQLTSCDKYRSLCSPLLWRYLRKVSLLFKIWAVRVSKRILLLFPLFIPRPNMEQSKFTSNLVWELNPNKATPLGSLLLANLIEYRTKFEVIYKPTSNQFHL